MKQSLIILGTALVLAATPVGAQDMITAEQFFGQVSERYAQIADYEARLSISLGKETMTGIVAFRSPAFLRIDFIQPPDQVISFNGELLVVYLPALHAVLQQETSEKPGAASASLATREGLKMMKRNYTIAYESSPTAVPLDEGSEEQVVRLVLSRKSVNEGFKTILLSISADTNLIRRIDGVTTSSDRFIFDFTGIKTNQNIPETRFIYDSPASANVYSNFLFGSDN